MHCIKLAKSSFHRTEVDSVKLTDWQLRMEMPPEASYIGLHHLPAHHMRIIVAVPVK
jgi:hypothetical protein